MTDRSSVVLILYVLIYKAAYCTTDNKHGGRSNISVTVNIIIPIVYTRIMPFSNRLKTFHY